MNYLSKLGDQISYIGIKGSSDFLASRRIILCNQLAAVTIANTLLYHVLFIGFGIQMLTLIHTTSICIYSFVLFLNKKERYTFAKNLLLVTVSIEIFLLSLALGYDSGIYLYYFPIACGGFLFYEYKEWRKALVIVCTAVLFIILIHLPVAYFDVIAIPISDSNTQTFFIISLISSMLITVLCVYHLINANFMVEKQLHDAFIAVDNLNKKLIQRDQALTHNLEQLALLTRKIDSEKAKLFAIVESANHFIWSVDTGYRLIYCNSGFNNFYSKRFNRQLQHGATLTDLLPDELALFWKDLIYEALMGHKFSKEIKGQYNIFEVFFNPIIEEKQVVGVTVFMQNISARKAAEQELIAAKEIAEQASKAKAQFLSTMSHEIRTPMNAVIGMTHLLLAEDPKPTQKENLNILNFSAQNLLALINDILDFSKIDAGKIEFEEVEFNIRELIESIRQTLAIKANQSGLLLEAVLDEAIPDFVTGDPVRLNQIITNLASNAVKFTPQGKISIEAMLQAKELGAVTINFAVKDTGIGIPEDKIEKIFDSFTQASLETTRKFGGTGLGLAITKRLLELQNSSIHVQSKVGVGSTFYFALSFKKNDKKVPAKANSLSIATGKENTQRLEGAKILLVEDNLINQLIASKFLLRWGLQIDIADDGLVAVERVQMGSYDLILMDLEMPGMDGYTATRTIRNLAGDIYKCIPIIALTASALSEVEEQVLAAGMNGYITKPFNPSEMFEVLASNILKRAV